MIYLDNQSETAQDVYVPIEAEVEITTEEGE